MTSDALIGGGSMRTTGCCPGCGSVVRRSHEWTTHEARDVFACMRCGTFRYGTAPDVPYAVSSYHVRAGPLPIDVVA